MILHFDDGYLNAYFHEIFNHLQADEPAAYHRGVLYGIDSITGPGTRRLVTINVTNGLVQAINVPLSASLSALASRTR